MDNRTKPQNSDAPFQSGGGAVDDLTPPTMQGGMQTMPMAPPPGVAPSSGADAKTMPEDMDRTMVGPTQTLPIKPGANKPSKPSANQQTVQQTVQQTLPQQTVATGRSGVHPSSLTGQDVATIVGDVPMQDLSSEQLLRDAPRLESCGQICPALNGIPLLYKLGQGGMGAVYYGIHPRLRSEVAVKVLPFHLAAQDPGMIQRFFREAQIAAKVRSPHLVNCIDVNEESGLFFLVMEFVPGVTVGSYLKKAIEGGSVGLPELDAIDICLAACLGLDAAHSNGVIHRDLKPDNIMIPYKSRQTKTFDIKSSKLMDLGLARNEEGNQSLTGVQAAMGTPGYMAPEQALDAKTADKRSDVFSMGATLYALLTGRPPFKGEVVMKVLMATMHEPHPPITNLRPDLSPGMVQLIDRCLDKRQENRFADARSLIRGLKAVRKVLSPDGAFGGEDDDGANAVEEVRAAPLIGTTGARATPAPDTGKSKIKLIGAGIGLAACLAIGYFAFGRGTKPPDKPIVDVGPKKVEALDPKIQKFAQDKQARSIDTIKQYISLKQFDQAELEFQDASNNASQYAAQLPELGKELTELRATFDSAKREDTFNNLAVQVDLKLKGNDVDEAKNLASKLDPVTPAQIEIKNKKMTEIIKIEQRKNNKGKFDETLYKAKNKSLRLDERIELTEAALKLIDAEPHALELLKILKVEKAKEVNEANFKKSFQKALEAYNNKNYLAANDLIAEARSLKSEDKDALDLQNRIVDESGDDIKKQLKQKNEKNAFDAFTKAQEFLKNNDTANALLSIDAALASVKTDDQYITFKKKVQLQIEKHEHLEDGKLKMASFDGYYKEAEENLALAKDVKSIDFLPIAQEKLELAAQMKLESYIDVEDAKVAEQVKGLVANLGTLKAKIAERKSDLETRFKYDKNVLDATGILAKNENEFESKLEDVDSGLKLVGDALEVLKAGKVVAPEEGKIAQDLKTKLDATRVKVVARDAKRKNVADFLASGEEAMKARKFDDALAAFKKAEPIAGELSPAEKEIVSQKMQLAVTGKENVRKVSTMLIATDILNQTEKYEEALQQIETALKTMDDPRLAAKKAEYEAGKAAILKVTTETLSSAQAEMKKSNLDGAVEVLDKVAAQHPNRKAIVDPTNDLKRIQQTAKDSSAKIESDLAQGKELMAKVGLSKGEAGITKIREATKEFPKLKNEIIAKLGAEGFEKSWKTANDFSANAGTVVEKANTGLGMLRGISAEIDAVNRKPDPPKSTTIEQQNGKKEGAPKGEQEQKLD